LKGKQAIEAGIGAGHGGMFLKLTAQQYATLTRWNLIVAPFIPTILSIIALEVSNGNDRSQTNSSNRKAVIGQSKLSAYVSPCSCEEDLRTVSGLCRFDRGLACLLCRIGGENIGTARERVGDDLLDRWARVICECASLQGSNFDPFKSGKTHRTEEGSIGVSLCIFRTGY
jgi:hypothetical protein